MKTVEYYLALPYTHELIPSDDGWLARIKELPGCITQGDNAVEALEMLNDALRGWIETALEIGQAVPEPQSESDFSGKFVVRLPHSLHRSLVEQAAEEGVSLNQWVNVLLAQSVGHTQAASEYTRQQQTPPPMGQAIPAQLALSEKKQAYRTARSKSK